VLQAGILRLDPAGRRVWLGEAEVHLSAKEFALLELFMRHPDQVLTRSQLLDHAWDFAHETTSNVVDQYVGYLRRKLGHDTIETVRGAGYRLTPPVRS
jgi:two-component system OmpR family response regulator